MKNKKLTNKNTQVRVWLGILYPDDPNLKDMIDTVKSYPNVLLMKHDSVIDDDNNIVQKEHYHFMIQFQSGMRLGTLLKSFNLDFDTYSHLFGTLTDFNRKSIDDEIIYDTHINIPDKKFYRPELFQGGLKDYAIKVINSLGKKPIDYFNETLEFLTPYLHDDTTVFWSVLDFYNLCVENNVENGFYRNWSKFKNIIDDRYHHI